MFRGLTPEQKALIAADTQARYLNGEEIKDIAPDYKTSERSLFRLLKETDPKGWWDCQWFRHYCKAVDAMEAKGFDRATRERRAADYRLDQLEKRRP